MNKAIELPQPLTDYILASSEPLGAPAHRVIEDTSAMPEWGMQISPEEAIFLRAIVRLVRPARILEVGTFTGLSSLVMAGALPEGGRITCLDVSEEFTTRARRAWEEAGVADRITLILGPALASLAELEGPYDLAFIDADKGNYRAYAKAIVPLLRSGGVLMADNTLWKRKVVGPDGDDDTTAIRSFNEWLARHPELDVEMIALADGVTLGIKRGSGV